MKLLKHILQFFAKNFLTGFIIMLGWLVALLGVQAFQSLTTNPSDTGNQSLGSPLLSMIWGTFNRQHHSLEALYENIKWYNDSGLKRMFLTANTYNGNLWWISGANQKCQTEADNNNLWWTWIAILWDNTQSFQQRFNTLVRENNYKLKWFLTLRGGEGPTTGYPYGPLPKTNLSYYSFFDTTFPISGLFNYGVSTLMPLPVFANGTAYNGSIYQFWSGTNSDGTTNASNCSNWTSATGNGITGRHYRHSTPFLHFNIYHATGNCASSYYLACMEI